MALMRDRTRGGSTLGFILLIVAVILAILIWLDPGIFGGKTPVLSRPMQADLTGYDLGDPAKPYPIRVFVNPDYSGAIAMNYRGKQYSQRFSYGTRAAEPEQVSITFQAQLYGTDQMPAGENYFLTLNEGGGAVLVWHDRGAQGQWDFAD